MKTTYDRYIYHLCLLDPCFKSKLFKQWGAYLAYSVSPSVSSLRNKYLAIAVSWVCVVLEITPCWFHVLCWPKKYLKCLIGADILFRSPQKLSENPKYINPACYWYQSWHDRDSHDYKRVKSLLMIQAWQEVQHWENW